MIGGGNFWRGRTSETIDRNKADQIGMLATVMNCIYVSDIFRHVGMKTEVFYTFCMWRIYYTVFEDSALKALDEGKVIFFRRWYRSSVLLYRYRNCASCD